MTLKNMALLARTCIFADTFKKTPNTDFLFCSPDGSKQDIAGNKHVDRFLDPIINELRNEGFKCTSLAWPYSEVTGNQCLNYTFRFNQFYALRELLYKFSSQKQNLNDFRAETFAIVLEQIHPKCVFGINLPPQFCEAAKKLDIPTVEVLHGFGYGGVFESWKVTPSSQLPTHVLSFDDVSTETFTEFGRNIFQVHQTSFENNTRFLLDISESKLTSADRSLAPEVLFSVQWGYDDDHEESDVAPFQLNNGLVPESVLAAVIETKGRVNWHFRLHPKQKTRAYSPSRKKIDKLLRNFPNAEWRSATKMPLQELLAQTTHHISMSSMVAHQAALQGVPTLFLDQRFKSGGYFESYQSDLKRSGMLQIGSDSTKEIIKWIDHTKPVDFQFQQTESHTLLQILQSVLGS